MLVVSGSIRLLNEKCNAPNTPVSVDDTESDDETGDDENDHDDSVEIADCLLLPETLSYRRLSCLVHTIQLVIKQVYKSNYQNVLSKARKLVARFESRLLLSKNSSRSVEKLSSLIIPQGEIAHITWH